VEAKRRVYGEIGGCLFAGLIELPIVADETAVAIDLPVLSQAEHFPDSPNVLITTWRRSKKRLTNGAQSSSAP